MVMDLSSHTARSLPVLHPPVDMRSIDANSVSMPVPRNAGVKLAPVNLVCRSLWSLPLVIGAGYCLFGFVATFEPMPPVDQWLWRAAYFFAGAGAVFAIAWLWLKPRRQA
jgi:hypothetical protein